MYMYMYMYMHMYTSNTVYYLKFRYSNFDKLIILGGEKKD